jgi:hypothetical protein
MREEEVFVVFLGMAGLITVACVIARYAFLTFKQWQSTALVRDMINRGYSAQEIIQICHALGHKKFPLKAFVDMPPAKPIRQPAYQ